MLHNVEDIIWCCGCKNPVHEPYIECDSCFSCSLCPSCYAAGVEVNGHQNSHNYEIVRNDFPLFNDEWTASEELRLLDAIEDHGIGNWKDVAQRVQTKTKRDCERHYLEYYVWRPTGDMPTFKPQPDHLPRPQPITFKLSEDPPRPSCSDSSDMAGYMAPRGDFSHEFANFAELDLRDMSFASDFPVAESTGQICSVDDETLFTDLKLAVVDVYQNRLRERFRRKKIIRDYGLINVRKNTMMKKLYEKNIPCYDDLVVFMRLLSPIRWDMFLESVSYESQLVNDIAALKRFRSAGLKRLHNVTLYEQLNKRRMEEKNKRSRVLTEMLSHIDDVASCTLWLHKQAVYDAVLLPASSSLLTLPQKKSAPPLNLCGLPGSEKLEENEKELCSTVRIPPLAYLEYKRVLIAECEKHGSLRLGQARPLIKIDVNKTRKIYDHLVAEALITKPQQS